MSDNIHYKVQYEITYPFTIEVWEWISNFNLYWVYDYFSMLGFKFLHVSKMELLNITSTINTKVVKCQLKQLEHLCSENTPTTWLSIASIHIRSLSFQVKKMSCLNDFEGTGQGQRPMRGIKRVLCILSTCHNELESLNHIIHLRLGYSQMINYLYLILI